MFPINGHFLEGTVNHQTVLLGKNEATNFCEGSITGKGSSYQILTKIMDVTPQAVFILTETTIKCFSTKHNYVHAVL